MDRSPGIAQFPQLPPFLSLSMLLPSPTAGPVSWGKERYQVRLGHAEIHPFVVKSVCNHTKRANPAKAGDAKSRI